MVANVRVWHGTPRRRHKNYIKLALKTSFDDDDDDVVLRHALPVFTGLGWCPIVSWDSAGEVGIFGPDALSVVHQWLLPGLEN